MRAVREEAGVMAFTRQGLDVAEEHIRVIVLSRRYHVLDLIGALMSLLEPLIGLQFDVAHLDVVV